MGSPRISKEQLALIRNNGTEAALQRSCEKYLTMKGYVRLCAKNAAQGRTGYYGHNFNSRKNAFMPDIFIFDHKGRYLNIELKVSNKYQAGQKEMIECGFWQLCKNLDEFIKIVKEWEV